MQNPSFRAIFLGHIIGLLFLFDLTGNAAEKLDPGRLQEIAALLPEQPAGFAWPITNRAAWDRLAADDAFKNAVANADAALARGLPDQPDSLFLEYSQNGNRTRWQKVASERRGRIELFTIAEAMENRGRYVPALAETITALCAEKTWILPAHDSGLRNFHGQEITPELGATGLAADLAEADYVLGDRLSPALHELIRNNIRRRVLGPFRAMIEGRQKAAFWLRAPMNWNPVCVGNTVFAALTLLDSREERAFYAAAGEHCASFYLRGFTPDGYCAEGVGYWNYGFGHFILLTEILRQSTGGQIDLLKNPRAMAAALYCQHSEILPGIFPTISDVDPGVHPSPQLTAYICHRLNLDAGTNRLAGINDRLALSLMLSSLPEDLPVLPRPESSGESPLRSYFPGGGVLISRTQSAQSPAFAVAIKGGNNDEPHNHNDVGSFSVVLGNKMIICDPGGEVYTARTFSAHRYDSKVLSSFGHAVPVIAGQLQKAGADARGVILKTNFTGPADLIQFDLHSAYPVPDLQELKRTFVFQRGTTPALEIRDEVAFSAPETFETALVTWGKIQSAGANALVITDGDRTVRISIDTQGKEFTWHQELINEDVMSKRKPHRVGITLNAPITSGIITLKIEPVDK